MILPLQGAQQGEGKALLAAAQLALEEEHARGPLPDGRKLALAVRDESGQWGQASSEILKLIEQDHALVLLTSASGNIAHQADQLANKISFPILTLASDPTTTQANVPWLFRLVPSDADQARAFTRRIYGELRLRKVLVVVQTDHDGRVGGAEFEKAAKEFKVEVPELWELSSSRDTMSLRETIQAKQPEAIVLWTEPTLAQAVLSAVRQTRPSMPVFLCTKAAQLGTEYQNVGASAAKEKEKNSPGLFSVVTSPATGEITRRGFAQHYRAQTGNAPGIAAFQAYEAVHLIAAGLRVVGANRVLLRDFFASEGKFDNATRIVPFDPAGNLREEFAIVNVTAIPAPSALP
jgi:branched-chain amino acid transport system substrate-binding protein